MDSSKGSKTTIRNKAPKFLIKLAIGLFFIGALASPLIFKSYNKTGTKSRNGDKSHDPFLYGFYLEDVTNEAEISFTHQSPKLDAKLEHILPQIASMGASVAVSDFDNDGWPDFYVTNSGYGTKNKLYKNMKDGTFQDVADESGLADVNKKGTGVSMGSVWGDFDNDGYEDLFLYKWGKPELFKNENGKRFVRVTDQSDFPAWINSNTAIWLDYNADGYLDIFIGGYYPEKYNLWQLKTSKILPESFEYADNGGRNYLFENQGDGTFKDVTDSTGLSGTKWTLAAAAADLYENGYPDIILANDFGIDQYFLNIEGKRFEEIGDKNGIGFSPKSGMNVTFGDVINVGKFGIYITNITEEGILMQGNALWMPSNTRDDISKFTNTASAMGIESGGWSYGAQFGDLNNDGSQDLYVANGFISGLKEADYWYDYSKVTGGASAIISDAANWPAMEGKSQSGYQQNRIWVNDGSGHFEEVASYVGDNKTLDSRAVALVDLWNRGALDIIVANQNKELLVYKNMVDPKNHWISFDLTGTESNRSAIGAIVKLKWNGKTQSQIVTGGLGFSSQNQRKLHFGLGKAEVIDEVVIQWPSGKKQRILTPEIDQVIKIVEPD